MTIGELLDAVRQVQTAEEGRGFMLAYRTVNEHADSNIGYILGYLDEPERKRLYPLLGVVHPIFGGTP